VKVLGAVVITRNEERNIGACLESLAFCDERVVVDAFSEDGTVEIALPLADKIYRRTFLSWGEQKNWALAQVECEWALIVDADERVGDELAQEIVEAIERDEHDAYWIRRRNHFFGKAIRGAGWGRDRVLRLLKVGAGWYDDRLVHEEIRLERGRSSGELLHRLEHFSYEDWPSTFERMLGYSGRGAADAHAAGQTAPAWKMVMGPSFRFWKQYLLQGGFQDGIHGLILCGLSASQYFLKLAKLRLGELPVIRRADGPAKVEVVQGPVPRGMRNP